MKAGRTFLSAGINVLLSEYRLREQRAGLKPAPTIDLSGQILIQRRPPGRRRIYCNTGSSLREFHVALPERQHVRLLRGTDGRFYDTVQSHSLGRRPEPVEGQATADAVGGFQFNFN